MGESQRDYSAAHVRERGIALLEEATEQSRPRIVAERVATNTRWFVQAALATALAWAAAIALFGHPRPIFAPVTALIVVSTTLGQRRRYAVEMVLGIALGIGIADALFVLIGSGDDTPVSADSPQFSFTAKRVGNAWLVVQGGSGLTQRVRVLNSLRIAKLDLHHLAP